MNMRKNLLAESIGRAAGRLGAYVLDKAAEKLATRLLRQAVPWATYAYNGGIMDGTGTGPTFGTASRFTVTEVKLDFAAIAAARVAEGRAAIAAADVLQLVGVKAGIWVPMVALQVVTAEGAVATCDLGDGATAAGFTSNSDLNAVGWSSSLITTTYSLATAGGKIYTVDDTIDMVVDSNNVDVAVCHVTVPMVDLRRVV